MIHYQKSLTAALLLLLSAVGLAQTIRVGAKHFNEGYILGEILSQLLESKGYTVQREFNLGGTLVCFGALQNNAIDVYPEYTGTLNDEILKLQYRATSHELDSILEQRYSVRMGSPLGFNNTYALAISRELAEQHNIHSISDLNAHPELRFALSYEFLKRKDGWENLKPAYNLPQNPVGIEHGLAYEALVNKTIDVTDAYSTDGEIVKDSLYVLNDDKSFFPRYDAVPIYRGTLDSKVIAIINSLSGKISQQQMQAMNAEVLYQHKTSAQVARAFLENAGLLSGAAKTESAGMFGEILAKTLVHLRITLIALLISIIIALPLGILVYYYSAASRPVLYIAGLLQTVPSIALLALMLPLFGIGVVPAIVALTLYGLLPILRNTTIALFSVDPQLKKVATGIGLTRGQQLRYVELPLSIPTIMAGIRTAAVINIGTATLAAFIGAGGLGEFIVTGLALNNTAMILEGAIPAAILAILVEFLFEVLEKAVTPKYLLQKAIS